MFIKSYTIVNFASFEIIIEMTETLTPKNKCSEAKTILFHGDR